jgi:lysophospholipase L1-like esterase
MLDKSRLLLFTGGTVPVPGVSSGDLAAEVAAREALATEVSAPVSAGLVDGSSDPFFRRVELILAPQFGAQRFFRAPSGPGLPLYTYVRNPVFDGRAIRYTEVGPPAYAAGRLISFADLGAVEGDRVTIKALIRSEGESRVYAPSRQKAGDALIGVQINAVPESATIGTAPALFSATHIVLAGGDGVFIYPYIHASGGDPIQILAIWAHRGEAPDGPNWPIFDADPSVGMEVLSRLGVTEGVAESAMRVAAGETVEVYDAGHANHDSTYSNAGAGAVIPAQASDLTMNRVTVWGGMSGAGRLRGYLIPPGTPASHAPAAVGTLLFEATVNWDVTVRERSVQLPELVTVPAGQELHLLWVSEAAAVVSIARWTTDAGGLRLMRICLSGAGDEVGIWSNSWVNGSPGYWTVPPRLELVNPASATGVRVPVLTIPAVVRAVVGTEICLQYDSICSAHSVGLAGISGYSVAITGGKGANRERFWSLTPVSGDIGSHALTATVRDAAGNVVASRVFSLTVVAATAKLSARNLLTLGDSLIAPGTITATAQAKFAGLSGGVVPIFVGSQGAAPAQHEGYGGWRYQDFATAGVTAYRLTVSGVTAVAVGAIYAVGGVQYTVREVDITGGAGTILATGGSAPAASGTLARVSGSGDASISYSSVTSVPGNPFWIGGTLDVAGYRAAKGIAAPIDAVFVNLGINDMGLGGTGNIAAIIGYAKALVDAFLADNASCKVILGLPPLCGNTADGFAANYGAVAAREVYEDGIIRLRQALLAAFDSGTYHANAVIGAAGLVVDRYYGYGRTTAAVASRISATSERHNNAVHPDTPGYQQMGDQLFAELMALI